ncbi:MAG: hypothetical protein ABJB05_09665 [Parafilimonas sp.]
MKYFFTIIFSGILLCANAQYKNPKLQVYITPGLNTVQLSDDDLIPPNRKNTSRIGDVVSVGLQIAAPLKNKRFAISGGLGFSQRHYSLNKYSFADFIADLFLFDSPYRNDTFNLSYVRFTNNYFQVPVSGTYMLTRPYHNFQLAVGLSLKFDFLIGKKATITFDETYNTPQTADIEAAKKTYTANTTGFVFTAAPYFESSFNVAKKTGLLFQFVLPSYYSSPLHKRLTTSTTEVFSFTFGAFYSLK